MWSVDPAMSINEWAADEVQTSHSDATLSDWSLFMGKGCVMTLNLRLSLGRVKNNSFMASQKIRTAPG